MTAAGIAGTMSSAAKKADGDMKARTLCLVLAGVAAASRPAPGAKHTGSTGFSFTYPDDWALVTPDSPPEAKAKLRSRENLREFEFKDLEVIIYRPESKEFCPNFTVGSVRGAGRFNEQAVQKLRNAVLPALREVGADMGTLKFALTKHHGKDAISASWEATVPDSKHRLRMRQLYVAGGSRTFIVTAAAAEPADTDVFGRVFDSFRVPTSFLGDLGLSPRAWGKLGGVAAVLVAGGIGAALRYRKRAPGAAGIGTAGGAGGEGAALPGFAPPGASGVRSGGPVADPLEALVRAGGTGPGAPPQQAPAPASPDGLVRLVCPCGQKLKVPAASSGKSARCPKCGTVLAIP